MLEFIDGLIKLLDTHGSFALMALILFVCIFPVVVGIFLFHRYVVTEAFEIFRNAVFGTLQQYVTQQEVQRQILQRLISLEGKMEILINNCYRLEQKVDTTKEVNPYGRKDT